MLSDSLELDFVLETIQQLFCEHGISLSSETLIHSDQGCHYASTSFQNLVPDEKESRFSDKILDWVELRYMLPTPRVHYIDYI